jgi:CheY-like chemotaxis protein
MGTALKVEDAADLLCRDPRTFFAYDWLQALALTRHLGGAVTLVDLDVMGNDGLSLIQNLREGHPEIPVIAISRLLGVP